MPSIFNEAAPLLETSGLNTTNIPVVYAASARAAASEQVYAVVPFVELQ